MSEQLPSIPELIHRALVARDEARSRGVGLRDHLIETTGSEEDADAILSTLEGIARNQKAIEESGESRAVFLAEKLEGARAQLPSGDTLEIPGVDSSADSATMARVVTDALLVSTSDGLEIEPSQPVTELESARQFMERDLGHPEDVEVAASISGALLPSARERLPENPFVAEAVTAAVALGIETAKVTYHMEMERIGEIEALERIMDRAAAAAGTLVEKVTPRITELGGGAIGAVVGAIVGMGPRGAQVGRELGRLAGTKVAKRLGEGVKKIVKSVGRVVVRKVVEPFATMGRKLLGWLS